MLLIVTILATTNVSAKDRKAEEVGKEFAQVTACHLAGKYNTGTKNILNLRIIDDNNVDKKGGWWKVGMKAGQNKEFKRLDNTNDLELAIMCGILKDRYL
ncbi:hypothetical protein BCU70_12960 [Vibrio sp. 10N.286.49.C2]|nr:hypothetical protein BCU70_12960 [Vibrio sp. 10N.286.49.C2]PMH54361.1 hypothetical protein BCU66_12005 [Vibrio sp. 10N.286.49.B1]PMH78468.1 hypothetical protein BCU58_00875 [Vibrio sp. 10N.286.48.B7]